MNFPPHHRPWLTGVAIALGVATLLTLVLVLVWLNSYVRLFRVTAQTQVFELRVTRGQTLEWAFGDAAFDCKSRKPFDGGLLLSAGVQASVYPGEVLAGGGAGSRAPWVIRLSPSDMARGEDDPPPLAGTGPVGVPGRALALPTYVCLDVARLGSGFAVPLRGRLTIGANVRPRQQALLLGGRLVLSEAPAEWMPLARFAGHYQFEAEQAELEIGDKVVLDSQDDCRATDPTCAETTGFARFDAGEPDKPMQMVVRAVSTGSSVDIVRPARPVHHLEPSPLKELVNDKILGFLVTTLAVLFVTTRTLAQWLVLAPD